MRLFGAMCFFVISMPCFASPCAVTFSVVWKDSLNNVKQGMEPSGEKWLREKMAKKYPGVCYAQPSENVPLVLFVTLTSATYHGTRTVSNSGRVTDDSGQTIAHTETDQEVPNSFPYAVFTLSLEQKQPDGAWKVLHNFRHNSICRTLYGQCVGNRHPNHAILEEAIKWMHQGGLSDPLQTVIGAN